MNIYTRKNQENKNNSIANNTSPQENKSNLTLLNNRPEVIAQRKMKELINNSSQVNQLKAYQELANNNGSAKQLKATSSVFNNNSIHAIQKKENNTGLPDNLKSGIENLSGYSMNDVKVHYNSVRPAQLQAHAYAQGTDIHLASGQEKHLPHEAWHVVQQKQGRVKPTLQMKGRVNVNDDAGLEKEADVMGLKASGFGKYNSEGITQREKKELSFVKGNDSKYENNSTHKNGFKSVLQLKWIPSAERGAMYEWDQLMEGVQWYSNASGNMWYEVKTDEGRRYLAGKGVQKKMDGMA
jgi:hypothetical protein